MGQVNLRSFIRFAAVGASATMMHYAIMVCLVVVSDAAVVTASAVGYIASTFYNYWANLHFTFGGGHRHLKSLPRFLVTACIGLGINQIVLAAGVNLLVPVVLAQLFATAAVLIWNYFVNAVWTFSNKM